MCPQQQTEDGFELQFGTNHLGHFLLTNLLLDLMKKSAPSRIVNVSSFAHKSGKMHFDDLHLSDCYGPFKAYRQSKLANILFTNELARRLEGTSINCYSLHPGVVSTNIVHYVTSWKRVLLEIVRLLLANNPEMGAQTTIYCAVEKSLANESGCFYR
ncbi:retinol dehydrogenase 14-like [Anneissia japonica]|uniref:retinol dehydrogenase 14-like n=1 Tax=Anneissia japonica TaxID=1529436 RepID=UPI001425803E|nr:retinol dehydrogenase 14-like [Anneissia japonica]